MTELTEVQKLTKAADEAARKAAEAVRPAHQQALQAAVELRDELSTNTSNRQKVGKLVAIIEAGTASRKPNKDAATTTLAQYFQVVTSAREVPGSKQRDGAFWLDTFPRYCWDWPKDQRLAVLDALMLAVQGKIQTGLTAFPKDLTETLRLDVAEHMAELSDPEATAKYREQQAALAEELSQAQRYVDALEQTHPKLAVTDLDQVGGVAIINKRGGDVSAAGVKFAGNAVTELTADQFARVRDDRIFRSYADSGVLQLTSTKPMAQAV